MKHIVGFSGGVDSQACARWVLNRYPPADVILTNSNAGQWEDPLTMAFVDTYSATVHPVVRCNAKVKDMWETPGYAETRGFDGDADLTFETMIQIKGCPPHRKVQFCTVLLKLAPTRRWMRWAFGPGGLYEGQDFTRYTGVRRDESDTRKATPVEQWDTWFDCPLVAPLVDWTKQMCFDYVKAHREPINPLYTLGFNRVGCAPCINSSKADIINWHARRPEMIEKVRGMEARTGITLFRPVDRDGVINGIDAVLRWAGTSRGGVQPKLDMMHERSGCESQYGLCE